MSHVRRFDHVGIAVADRAGLDRLDGPGARVSTCVQSDNDETPPLLRCFRWWDGVAVWWS